MLTRLAAKHGKLHVCYEAGPTGYGLYRQVIRLGHECTVVAPSLIPRKAGDRVKTKPARRRAAGPLTAGWRVDCGLGTRRRARSHARPGPGARGCGRRSAAQAAGHLVAVAEARAGIPR